MDASLLIDLNPFSPGLSNLVVSTAAALLRVPIALGVLTLALFLIMKGRAGNTDLGTGGLLLAMVALIILVVTYPAALDSAGLSTPQPTDLFGAIVTCAAAGTLVWLALSLRRGARGHDTVRLRNTLARLAGLLLASRGPCPMNRRIIIVAASVAAVLAGCGTGTSAGPGTARAGATTASSLTCKQRYLAWEHGPAHAAADQFIAAQKRLQAAGSTDKLPAITGSGAADSAWRPEPADSETCTTSRRRPR